MRWPMLAFTFAFALAACSPPAPEQPPSEVVAAEAPALTPAACEVRAASTWRAGETALNIEADASGPSCAHAVATLTVRAADGRALYSFAKPTEHLSSWFNPSSGAAGLQTELEAWILGDAQHRTADTLPAWPEGAAKPPYFATAFPREEYEAARTARLPTFCFGSGTERATCVALHPEGFADELGVQTFESE